MGGRHTLGRVSDLQCPATFWLVAAGEDGDAADPARLTRLRAALGATHVAAVHAGPGAQRLAAAAAESVGAPLQTMDELDGPRHGEAGAEAFRRWRAAVEEVADLYRGETVVVVGEAASLDGVLPGAAADVLRIEVDGDGWRVTGRA